MTTPINDPTEIWVAIPGYEGLYEFSNFFRVRSLDRDVPHPISGTIHRVGRDMPTYRTKSGHICIHLSKDGKVRSIYVDKLVAEKFTGIEGRPDSLPNEEWKPIPSYEGLYAASNLGRIWSVGRYVEGARGGKQLRRGRIISGAINRHGTGYYQIVLSKENRQKTREVHRLIAITWVPNPKRLRYVNHIDGNSLNNVPSNLEWCTQRHNVRNGRHVRTFPIQTVADILSRFAAGMAATTIAKELGISHKSVLALTARWRDAKS